MAGTLFSCILRATNIIIGPPPPDGGGGVDPDGGCLDINNNGICDDDEADDCDDLQTYYYCIYTDQECGSVNTFGETDYSKEDLLAIGAIGSCSDPFPENFIEGGVLYSNDPGLLDCCVDVTYYFCQNPFVPCPGLGCTGEQVVSFNSISPDSAPPTFVLTNGKTGYKDTDDCSLNEDFCCTDIPDAKPTCTVYFCEDGKIKSVQASPSDFTPPLEECPVSTGQVYRLNGKDVYVSRQIVASFCFECERWICSEATGNCESNKFTVSSPGPNNCGIGFDSQEECETFHNGEPTSECCEQYDDGTGNPPGQMLENHMAAAYGFINIPYNDNTGDEQFVFCPGDESILFSPQGLNPIFTGDSIYSKSVVGIAGIGINQSTGDITIPLASITNNSNTKIASVTFTRGCGNPQDTATVDLFLDPSDFRGCEDLQDCLDNGVQNCDPVTPPQAIDKILLIQPQPIFNDSPTSQPVQFASYVVNEEKVMLIPSTTYANLDDFWRICFDGINQPATEIDVVALDQNNNFTELTNFQWDPPAGQFSFNITNVYDAGYGRQRLTITGLNPGDFTAQSAPGFLGSITASNSTNSLNLNIYSCVNTNFPNGIQTQTLPTSRLYNRRRR